MNKPYDVFISDNPLFEPSARELIKSVYKECGRILVDGRKFDVDLEEPANGDFCIEIELRPDGFDKNNQFKYKKDGVSIVDRKFDKPYLNTSGLYIVFNPNNLIVKQPESCFVLCCKLSDVKWGVKNLPHVFIPGSNEQRILIPYKAWKRVEINRKHLVAVRETLKINSDVYQREFDKWIVWKREEDRKKEEKRYFRNNYPMQSHIS